MEFYEASRKDDERVKTYGQLEIADPLPRRPSETPAVESPGIMSTKEIVYRETQVLPAGEVVALYRANGWSSAERPELRDALAGSHSVVSAWDGERLVGLANALSDGHLVVYYPHLLVLLEYQGRGIGTRLMRLLMDRYAGFHQQVIVADGGAVEFYRKCGFERAGQTEPMWIYKGDEH